MAQKPVFDNSGNLVSKEQVYNYKYTFSGSESVAPVKVFDDGKFTYFKFRTMNEGSQPRFYIIDGAGKETFVNAQISGEYFVVNQVAEKFALQKGEEFVSVYNENIVR